MSAAVAAVRLSELSVTLLLVYLGLSQLSLSRATSRAKDLSGGQFLICRVNSLTIVSLRTERLSISVSAYRVVRHSLST